MQKGFAPILIVLLLAVVGIGGYFVYTKYANIPYRNPMQNQKEDNSILSTPTPVTDNTIKFDVEKVKVGDKIGSITIIEIRGNKSEKATAGDAHIAFTGKVTVTGDIIYYQPGSYLGELVCMENLDSDSQAKMPKMASQSYVTVSFCFNDLTSAKKLLVKDVNVENQGKVTVTIDNYIIKWFPSSVYNTADLITVSPNLKQQNLIEFGKIKVGDVISGLTVKSIKPFNNDLPMSDKNFAVEFSGKINLSGRYTVDDSKSFYTNTVVLFDPDVISSAKLPYAFSSHIEFKNSAQAVELLSQFGKSGNVTVEIENYSTFFLDKSSFGGGSANLVRVIK